MSARVMSSNIRWRRILHEYLHVSREQESCPRPRHPPQNHPFLTTKTGIIKSEYFIIRLLKAIRLAVTDY